MGGGTNMGIGVSDEKGLLKRLGNFLFPRTIGVRVETFGSAGRFDHNVYDIGLRWPDRSEAVSEELVNALKKANEEEYNKIPAGIIVTEMKYKTDRF